MNAFSNREVELHVITGYASGLAPFKADNANTPIAPKIGSTQKQFLELVTISEKDILKATDLERLKSRDTKIKLSAIRDLTQKAISLRIRNTNRTIWMAWTAAKGSLPIVYPKGASITVNWDFEGSVYNTHFSGSHLPVAETAWNTTNDSGEYTAPILDDVETWSKLIADDLGVDENEVVMHVNSTTLKVIKKNTEIRGQLSATQPRILTPKVSEIAEILGIGDVKKVNDYYWDTTQSKVKYLPDGYALFTSPYVVNGIPIMEMLDGPVARVVNGSGGRQIVVENNPGMRAETYIDADAVVESVRVTTARMPVVNYPEAFVYAKLW